MQTSSSRLPWEHVPVAVRDAVASRLGSAVVVATNQTGGFSPGVASRCVLADGRRCFIKAVSSEQNPDSPLIHRREADVASRLPASVPAPRLWTVVDDGEWVVLVFDDVEGVQPELPWSLGAVGATLAALDDLATPASSDRAFVDLPTFADRHRSSFAHFRLLAGGDERIDRVDDWTRRHLAVLAELESEWEAAADGVALLHSDVRADNLLIREDGSVVLVDWPHACTGAPWIDKVCFLPSVGLDGGPSPVEVEATCDPFRGIEPDLVDRVLVGLAGYFTVHGLAPDPPGIPTVRAFQRAQGTVARQWLATRRGLI